MKNNKKIKMLGLGLALLLSIGAFTSQAKPINAARANIVQKDKKKRITKVSKFHQNNMLKQTDIRSYRGDTKRLYKRTIVNLNGGKTVNSWTTSYVYTYNRMGQLKSNRYGKATRIDRKHFLNNKISAQRTCTYNAKGKLKCTKWNTKSFVKNKAVAVYKTTPAQYKTIPATYKTVVVTPAQPAKPAVTKKEWVPATKGATLYGTEPHDNYMRLSYGPEQYYSTTLKDDIASKNQDYDLITTQSSAMLWSYREIYEPKGLAVSIVYKLSDYGYDGSEASRIKAYETIGVNGLFGKEIDRVNNNIIKYAPELWSTTNVGAYPGYETITKIPPKDGYYKEIIVSPAVPAKPAVTKQQLVTPAKKVLVKAATKTLVRYK